MIIIVKSKDQTALMREAAKVTGYILKELEDLIEPGISTMDVNDFCEKEIFAHGMIPTFKGYGGFPATACVSLNEEIAQGIPDRSRIIREGDIVTVDLGATFRGYASDAARTYGAGSISDDAAHLIKAAEDSFFAGLEFCRAGKRVSDISHAVQVKAESEGFGVVREFTGHGIGRELHEDPQIPNHGRPGRGPRIAAGMVFAIEPMITRGSCDVKILQNGMTAVTADGKLSAHYENTVVITDDEPEIITLFE